MALPDLIVTADLTARGVDTSATALVNTMMAVASSVIRGAAGSPILEADSTVVLWAVDAGQWLDLPGRPVTAVASVDVDGVALAADDFKLVDGRLWGWSAWSDGIVPVMVEVELTHGLAAVPAHIKQLACDLVIAGMNAATQGANPVGVVAERIDDYSVTYAQGAEAVASAVELPKRTRLALRKQFGGGAGVMVSR